MKKKITALVLAIGLLLMAQPALAQGEPLPSHDNLSVRP